MGKEQRFLSACQGAPLLPPQRCHLLHRECRASDPTVTVEVRDVAQEEDEEMREQVVHRH